MASELAAQLLRLAEPKDGHRPRKGKASLLYDFQVAADIDVQTIHSIALSGLDELCTRDVKIAPYRELLYGTSSLNVVRENLTAEENDKLNSTISAFLRLLGNHFLLGATFKALEYLIRRYRINEFNVNELIACGLPYHATNEFVRLVQILKLKRSVWSWMSNMQTSGAALPREVLRQRCANDGAVLRFTCEEAQRLASLGAASTTYWSFYAVLLCEMIAGAAKVSEDQVTLLVQYLLPGMLSPIRDYQAASLMVLTQLLSNTYLSSKVLNAVTKGLLQRAGAEGKDHSTVVMMLAHLARTQVQYPTVPLAAVDKLAAMKDLPTIMSQLWSRQADLLPLVSLLVNSTTTMLTNPSAGKLLQCLVESVPLPDDLTILIINAVMEELLSGKLDEECTAVLQKCLRTLDLRYPQVLDPLVNAHLKNLASQGLEGEGAVRVLDVFHDVFRGSLREPLTMHQDKGKSSQQGDLLTLAAALNAPQEGIRRLAVSQIAAMVLDEGGAVAEDLSKLVREVLPGRLMDDSQEVVLAVLASPLLEQLDPLPAFDLLSGVLRRTWDTSATEGMDRLGAAVMEMAMKQVVRLTQRDSQLVNRAVSVLGEYLVADKLAPLVGLHALTQLSLLPHPLGQHLSKWSPELEVLSSIKQGAAEYGDDLLGYFKMISNEGVSVGETSVGKRKRPSGDGRAETASGEEPTVKRKRKRYRKKQSGSDGKDVGDEGKGTGSDPDCGRPLLARHAMRKPQGKLDEKLPAAGKKGPPLYDVVIYNRELIEFLAGRCVVKEAEPLLTTMVELYQQGGLRLQNVALVVLCRALKMHGGDSQPQGSSSAATSSLKVLTAQLMKAVVAVVKEDYGFKWDGWAAKAGQFLDEDFRLTSQYCQSMRSQGRLLQALILLMCSHQLLEYLSPVDIREAVGDVHDLFLSLTALPANTAMYRHARLILDKVEAGRQLQFLRRYLGCPDGAFPISSRLTSVRLTADVAEDLQQPEDILRTIPLLIVVLSSTERQLRSEGLAALKHIYAHLVSSTSVKKNNSAEVLVDFLRALEPRHSLIVSDPTAASRVLALVFDSKLARVSPKKKSKKQGSEAEFDLTGVDLAKLRSLLVQYAQDEFNLWSHHSFRWLVSYVKGSRAACEFTVQLCNMLPAVVEQLGVVELEASVTLHNEDFLKEGVNLALDLLELCTPVVLPKLSEEVLRSIVEVVTANVQQLQLGSSAPDKKVTKNVALLLPLRLGLVKHFSPEFVAVLPPALSSSVVNALLVMSTGEMDEQCRTAAREALEKLEIAGDAVVSLLLPLQRAVRVSRQGGAPAGGHEVNAGENESTRKRKKSSKASKEVPQTPAAPPSKVEVDLSLASLEVLQWKDNITDTLVLARKLQELLGDLVPSMGSTLAVYEETGDKEQEESEGPGSQEADAGSPILTPSSVAYAAQLALTALLRILERLSKAEVTSLLPVPIVLQTAEAAQDAVVRHAALLLLHHLAKATPSAVVDQAVRVVYLVQTATSYEQDVVSVEVAQDTLAAMVQAWTQAGRAPTDLVKHVVEALPDLAPTVRVGLMRVLMRALGEDVALPLVVYLLVEGMSVLLKNSSNPHDYNWRSELADSLLQGVQLPVCLHALAQVLDQCLQKSDGQAHTPLCRTAVGLTTHQIKVSAKVPLGSDTESLEGAGQQVMSQALVYLQILYTTTSQMRPSKRKAIRKACTSLYHLMEALDKVMDTPRYLTSLLQMASHEDDLVRRRAVRLFTARVQQLPAEMKEAARKLPASRAEEMEKDRSVSALAISDLVVRTFSSDGKGKSTTDMSLLTQQAVLTALETAARLFGESDRSRLSACLPHILSVVEDGNCTKLRSAALQALAPMITSLGPLCMPDVPRLMKVVLSSMRGGRERLSSAMSGHDKEIQDGEEIESDSKEEAEDKEDAEGRGPQKAAGSLAAAELSAGLTVIQGALQGVGAFLNPFLLDLLSLILHPQVLSCEAEGCGEAAVKAVSDIGKHVPARLLLEPAFKQWERVVAMAFGQHDAQDQSADRVLPACTLLSLLSTTVNGLTSKTMPVYMEGVFTFLLRAFDLRHQHHDQLSEREVIRVEDATLNVLEAMVMKLSESQFRPLFIRLLEWSNSLVALSLGGDGTGQASTHRGITLLRIVIQLCTRLRSLFVPYFRHLLPLCTQYLTGQDYKLAKKKKKKKTKDVDVELDEETGQEATNAVWVLKLMVVRALHRCFLYDTVDFLTPERFNSLLGPLVSHVEAEPPEEIGKFLQQMYGQDSLVSSEVKPGPHKSTVIRTAGQQSQKVLEDVMGTSVVHCLVQMAVTAGSDSQWKQLNQMVLLLSRGRRVRTRLLVLEVVSGLVERLKEEYLVLLPETLPFLAELLEDSDMQVEQKTQQVVRMLEELSGEKLEQYMTS